MHDRLRVLHDDVTSDGVSSFFATGPGKHAVLYSYTKFMEDYSSNEKAVEHIIEYAMENVDLLEPSDWQQ